MYTAFTCTIWHKFFTKFPTTGTEKESFASLSITPQLATWLPPGSWPCSCMLHAGICRGSSPSYVLECEDLKKKKKAYVKHTGDTEPSIAPPNGRKHIGICTWIRDSGGIVCRSPRGQEQGSHQANKPMSQCSCGRLAPWRDTDCPGV